MNDALGRDGWTPIELRLKDDYIGAIAAYGLYDVLLVNPVIDGMNLVAMEGPLLNRRRGVLVLSRNAGAYGRLGRYALGVNPFDIDEMADAIEDGDHDARWTSATRRARGLSRLVLANPPARWVGGAARGPRARRRRRRSAPAAERPQELDEPGRALDDHVGRLHQRRRRLGATDGDLTVARRLRSRQPVERSERVEVGDDRRRRTGRASSPCSPASRSTAPPFIGRSGGTSSSTILPSISSSPASVATGCSATRSAARAATGSGACR